MALRCFPGIEACVKDLSSSLLTAGLEKNGADDFEEFKRGMVVARTGCIVGCDAFFGGYANWFAKTFGDEQTSLGKLSCHFRPEFNLLQGNFSVALLQPRRSGGTRPCWRR